MHFILFLSANVESTSESPTIRKSLGSYSGNVLNIKSAISECGFLFKTLSLAKSAIRHNMTDDLPKMDTNTLIIWGKQDIVTPPNVAEEFNSLLPNSELSWIDKCGHAPMMEHPKDFNIIMENWLSKNNL